MIISVCLQTSPSPSAIASQIIFIHTHTCTHVYTHILCINSVSQGFPEKKNQYGVWGGVYVYIKVYYINLWLTWLWRLRRLQLASWRPGRADVSLQAKSKGLRTRKADVVRFSMKASRLQTKKSQYFSLRLNAGKDQFSQLKLSGRRNSLTQERVSLFVLFRPLRD